MNFCSNCGNKFNESDKFCSNCGQSKGIETNIKPVEKEKSKLYMPKDSSVDEIGKYVDSELLSDFYKGELLNGQKHGRGILMASVWDVSQNDFVEYKEYEGEFKYDKKDGFGVEYNLDGEKVYEGNWKDDKYNGKGKYYSDGRLYYKGSWLNGIPHGEGEIYDVDSDELVYEGKVNNGLIRMNGDTYKILGADEDDNPLNPEVNDDPLGIRDKSNDTNENDPLGIRENSSNKFDDVDLTEAEFIKLLTNKKADYRDIDF